jgi:hypothetical protein
MNLLLICDALVETRRLLTDTCNLNLQTSLKIIGKDNSWVPVTRMDKGMGKNSYPYMGMSKLMGKIFLYG